jgi:hypothetical protein
VETGRRLRKRFYLSPTFLNLYNEYLTKESLEGFGDFRIGGQAIRTVMYVDDLVLMTVEETGLMDRLI